MFARYLFSALIFSALLSACATTQPQKPLSDQELDLFVAALERSAVPPDHPEITFHNRGCIVYFKQDLLTPYPFSTEEVMIVGRPDLEHWKVQHPDGSLRIMPKRNIVCVPCREAVPEILKKIKEWKIENGIRQ